MSAGFRIELAASRSARALVVAGTVAVVVNLVLWPGPAWIRGLLAITAIVVAGVSLDRLRRDAGRVLEIASTGTCRLRQGDRTLAAGRLGDRWFVSPWLICLRIHAHQRGRTTALAVFRDAVTPEDFRRLATRLRHPA